MNFQSKSILAVVLVIIALALGYFAVLPRWASYKDARAQLADANTKHEQLVAAQKQLDSFLAEYRQHLTEAQNLNNSLPLNEGQVYNFLKNLDDLSKATGLSLGNLSIVDSPDADPLGAGPNTIRAVNVSFVTSGSSAAVTQFLSKIESNLRIIDITNIDMSSDDNTGNIIKYQIKLRVYYQK